MHVRKALLVAALVVLATVAVGGVATPAAAQEDCSFPVTQTDATGTEVTLDEPAEEIVVTAPSVAQTIWELGEEDRVVGLDAQNSAYLEGAEEKTHVLEEGGIAVDVEQVVALDPDLVIVPSVTSDEEVQDLRDAGLTVFDEGESDSIEAIQENVRAAGAFLDACDDAEDTVQWMDETLDDVDEAVADEDRPVVYNWVAEGMTAPEGTFQHDLLVAAGAQNAATEMDVGADWFLADEEQIVDVDPEYLLLTEGSDVPDNEAIQSTTAVEEDQIVYVDANHWQQNAPRVVLAVEEIAEQLHPEAFEADAGAEDDADDGVAGESGDDADGAADGDDADDAADRGGDDGTPGFGVPAAVAAVLAALVLARRRV